MDETPLIVDDHDRYGRLRLISWWRQDRLAASRVLVVGAGALGNEALKNLALVGVGAIHIVDFDVVEPSNLARSVFFRAADAGRPKAEVAAERAR
ncbi:MAG: ThiF family adenylyltransferase, partial [Planctomycetota bacterium]|nr:ThiF family adenylyltransferase [Planctomycetota bacterium]